MKEEGGAGPSAWLGPGVDFGFTTDQTSSSTSTSTHDNIL